MALREYQRKRDFHRTPEPRGKAKPRKSAAGGRFVIQQHAATRLHYDFRLELDGDRIESIRTFDPDTQRSSDQREEVVIIPVREASLADLRAAVKLANSVNVTQMKKRTAILTSLSQAKRLAFHDRHIGTTIPVLFEAGHHDGYALGTTANFLKVAVPSQTELTNQMHPVTITAASERWAIGHLTAHRATTTMLPML